MQIFVSGVWSEKKAAPYASQAISLGKLIASGGYDLSCGPGTGIAKYVIEGYRSIEKKGNVRFYLPLKSEMEKVGEKIGSGADEIIETEFDYPLRNIYQIRQSDAVVVITGGDGALEEAIVALADYKLPVVALKDSGNAAKALEMLSEIFSSWHDYLMIGDDVSILFAYIDNHLSKK